jgi:NADPH-dependent 2,4-dienoyl-CoA reductase/sulfur reductase-like enzyme/rhodanese-related sulfurtransferase
LKLVIIGGGAGGPTAAARARRLDEFSEIVMFERGENVSFAHCGLPYYIGGVIGERKNLLVSNPHQLRKRYNIDVRLKSEVKAILPATKEIEVVDLTINKTYSEKYDHLILSTGAEPFRPETSGEASGRVFVLRNLADADSIFRFISERKPRRAVCIGGGFIGLEMVENLRLLNIEVTVVEMASQLLPPLDPEMAEILEDVLIEKQVKLLLSTSVSKLEQNGDEVIVKLKQGDDIPCDMVLLSTGVKPRIELALKARIEVGNLGGIKVNQFMQTSDPSIYAVGDSVETMNIVTGKPVIIPLAGPANRQARIAADNIYGRKAEYRGTLGTAGVSLFGVTAGMTGVSEKTLKSQSIPYKKCYLHPFSHATYYPDAEQMALKLLFAPGDGRILGVQIVGGAGVDKRIDVIATAIMANMNVHDLTDLELAYAPQIGSAKDAINMAGYVASNILLDDSPTAYWDELEGAPGGKPTVLDVRTRYEYSAGNVPGSVNIPVDDLRERLAELPKDMPVVTYCSVGQRSNIATRMLKQRGFNIKNLSGGFISYEQSHKNKKPKP